MKVFLFEPGFRIFTIRYDNMNERHCTRRATSMVASSFVLGVSLINSSRFSTKRKSKTEVNLDESGNSVY